MTFSSNGQALLNACAQAIAYDLPSDIDLSSLHRERDFHADTPQYLAERVELLSQGSYTIRVADTALFKFHLKGINRYLVRCPVGTPDEVVTELTADMFLVSIGPYSNGFRIHAEQASPEAVAEYRAFIAKHNAERIRREAIEEAAAVKSSAIVGTLLAAIDRLVDDERKSRIYIGKDPSIQKVAEICEEIGLPLEELFATALG